MKTSNRLLFFYIFLFLIASFIVFFLKKETFKVIKTIDGRVVKTLPPDASVKILDDRHILIDYSWKREILTWFYDIDVKSRWGLSLQWWKYFRKGLDVAWWVRLTYKIDLSKYKEVYKDQPFKYATVVHNVINVIKRNIDSRISKLGVADYSIRIIDNNGEKYLQVEIWGIKDIDYAKSIIWKTVELEFMLPYEWAPTPEIIKQRYKIAENILNQVVNSGKKLIDFVDPRVIMADLNTQLEYNNWKALFFISATKDKLPGFLKDNLENIEKLGTGKVVPKLFTWTLMTWWDGWFIVKYLWSTIESGTVSMTTNNAGSWSKAWTGNIMSGSNIAANIINKKYNFELLFISFKPYWVIAKDPKTGEILNGAYFRYATVDRTQSGEPAVVINFDDKGKEIFAHITEENVGKQNAIFIWWKLITAPVIREPIRGWTAQITGRFTPEKARKLAKDLNEWALPAKLILIHEEKIAPLLGEKALNGAVMAGIVGFVLIFVMLLLMYNLRWSFIAMFSLVEFIIVTLAFVKLIDYALSLAGISAIVLSIGMWVDANILMYERIREELKTWKVFWLAVVDWLKRSWNAIRDGNLTTFAIAFLLFSLGMNVFKGFGFMMMLSIFMVLTIIVPLTKELLLKFWESK